MSKVVFMRKDGMCSLMKREMSEFVPKYLYDPIEFNGKMTKFYGVFSWINSEIDGVSREFIDNIKINYVDYIDDLPEGAGVYTSLYEADLVELKKLEDKGVPIIRNTCPWVKNLNRQLLEANFDTHQGVIMLLKGNIIEKRYRYIYKDDFIIVDHYNFKEELRKRKNKKPIQLFVYASFSQKAVVNLINHIDTYYPHHENILNGYKDTLCGLVVEQGIFEEIEEKIKKYKLDEIWIIARESNETTIKTFIYEINEAGSKYMIIKGLEDIPEKVDKNLNVGVVVTPTPLIFNVDEIKENIRAIFDTEII
jgi:hypothetical protein